MTDAERSAIRFLRTAICVKTDCDVCRKASAALFGDDESSALCRLDVDGDGAVWKRLADLIDPTDKTCELELTWGGQTNAHVRTYECSRCGKSCDNVWGEDYEFCPYCGRRVEYADE